MAVLEGQSPVYATAELSEHGLEEKGGGPRRLSEAEIPDSVNFATPEDPLDPLNWSRTYKWLVVALVSMSTTIA